MVGGSGSSDAQTRQARVDAVRWYHDFDFGEGVRATSHHENPDGVRAVWAFIARQLARVPFAGATVLDVGAWDGYWSFFAERHGAREVLAVDDASQRWADDSGIALARELLGSRIAIREDVPIYEVAALGRRFDVVLCLGVFYHLWDPLYGFAQLRHCCHRDTLVIVEGEVAWGGLPANGVRYAVSSWQECVLSASALEALLRLAYLRVDERVWMHAVPDEAAADGPPRIDRSLLVCRPFTGRNSAYQYRPHFGLHAYDDRFADGAAEPARRASIAAVASPPAVAAADVFTVTCRLGNTGRAGWRALRCSPATGAAPLVEGASVWRRPLAIDERLFVDRDVPGDRAGDGLPVAIYRDFLAAGGHSGCVTLGAQLWDSADAVRIERDYGRGFLAADVPPGGMAEVAMRLRAPRLPGRYWLHLDPVCEDVCWFADDGGTPLRVPILVGSGSAAP